MLKSGYHMSINKKLKAVLSLAILTFSLVFIVYFFITHPGAFSQLSHLNIVTIIVLLLLDVLGLAILAVILTASLALCGIKIPKRDSLIVTGYSSIINFFGPLQSGPAFRVLYLKSQHNVPIKKFVFTTFLYYGIYAIISAIFLCIHVLPWWQTILVLIIIAGLVGFILKYRSDKAGNLSVHVRPLTLLAIATLAQVVVQTCSYFVEVRTVDPHVHIAQVITYTGAANFSLFVALTPGAIGFRESFLVLSQHLHHISTTTILAANVIDRAVYILFLLLLAIPIIWLHTADKILKNKRPIASTDNGKAQEP